MGWAAWPWVPGPSAKRFTTFSSGGVPYARAYRVSSGRTFAQPGAGVEAFSLRKLPEARRSATLAAPERRTHTSTRFGRGSTATMARKKSKKKSGKKPARKRVARKKGGGKKKAARRPSAKKKSARKKVAGKKPARKKVARKKTTAAKASRRLGAATGSSGIVYSDPLREERARRLAQLR